MKSALIPLTLACALSAGSARAQSYEPAPPMAPNPSAQYQPSETDYDEGDNVAETEEGYYEDAPAVDDATFNESLSGYGAWVTVAGLRRVWRPYPTQVGADFQPYVTNGHWVYTDLGWTWVSDWNWGWAPFHYGRWWLDDYYGWVWMPGYTWSPAWVTWRWGSGYIGWMPLAPWGFHYHRAYWQRSWCFVDEGRFTSNDVGQHRQPATQVLVVHARTSPGASHSGPPVGNVAHATGSPIRAQPVSDSGALPANPVRPRPVNPSGPSGGAGQIKVPATQSSPYVRPQEIRRPSQVEVQPPPTVQRPTTLTPTPRVERPSQWSPPPQVERPAQVRPTVTPSPQMERPSQFRPDPRPAMAPPQPQVRPSTVQRPSPVVPHPSAAPAVVRPAPARVQQKK